MKIKMFSAMLCLSVLCSANERIDVYWVDLNLRMPRVYDNFKSLGKRKYQRQKISGKMFVSYKNDGEMERFWFSDFTNKTHSIDGKPVTYTVDVEEDSLSNFSWCGDNKKKIYNFPNCNFSITMVPSYKIGDEMLDDVHLTISCTSGLSRKIKVDRKQTTVAYILNGFCAGQIGCNCTAWGHVSPTRFWNFFGPSVFTTDVASVNGSVKLRFLKNESRK